MSLNAAQLATFKAAINADPNLTAFLAQGNEGAIAAYYNAPSATEIWIPNIPAAVLNTAVVWSAFIALPVQTQNAYFALVSTPTIDATNANIRAGFSSIFGAGQTLTNLTAIAQRLATVFENLFTVGNVCSLYGFNVQVSDIAQALGP